MAPSSGNRSDTDRILGALSESKDEHRRQLDKLFVLTEEVSRNGCTRGADDRKRIDALEAGTASADKRSLSVGPVKITGYTVRDTARLAAVLLLGFIALSHIGCMPKFNLPPMTRVVSNLVTGAARPTTRVAAHGGHRINR